MTMKETERLAVVENDVKYIKDSIDRIETALTAHIDNESGKIHAMDKEVADIPNKMSGRFAGIWVEAYTKAIIFTIGGSIVVGIIFSFITK